MSLSSHDIRVAARLLWKDKSFTLATVLTLGLCVGANTALFSIVNSVLLQPLPVPGADRLVLLYNSYPRAGADRGSSGVPDYLDRVKGVSALESLCLYNVRNRATGEAGRPERVLGMGVTPSFFRVAGVAAELGRTFTEDEGELGRDDKVLLSHRYWQERFGGDSRIVGRSVRLDGRQFTVVGVMPDRFRFLEDDVRLWTPLAFYPAQKSDEGRHNNSWTSVGRLKAGATLAQAQAQVDAINAADLERFPQLKPLLVNAGFHTVVAPLQHEIVRDIERTLYLLWGGTLFVLLIGCVNVVNLALVRARGRVRDLATRMALGAGRARIARQLLIESLLVTFVAAALGLLLGWGGVRLLATLNLEQLPRASEIRVDLAAVLFTAGLASALGLVIGLFPLVAAFNVNLSAVLHEGGRTGSGGRGARLVRRVLVAAQVAVAFVLLLGAGLLVASFQRILGVDPGFDGREVMTASVSLPGGRYPEDKDRTAFTSEALRRLRALPGVAAAGATSSIPFGHDHSDSVIFAEGYQMQPGESVISPTRIEVSPGYFETMRIPLKRGRYFEDRDGRSKPHVIIVDERLARRFWPNTDPVGRRMYRPNSATDLLTPSETADWLTVVGVVGEVKQDDLASSKAPVGAYYLPIEQEPIRSMTFAVRTAGAEPEAVIGSVRRQIAALDPELPVFSARSMQGLTEDSLVARRWPMLLSLGFGLVALALSAVGIYGVLAYLVTQRTKEIGIRMALGGTPRSIFDLVLREGLALLAAGFLAGGVGAFVLRKSLEGQLFGVQPSDARVIAAVALMLAAVALVACAMPARRATRIDPVIALNRD
jgi:predicted permease